MGWLSTVVCAGAVLLAGSIEIEAQETQNRTLNAGEEQTLHVLGFIQNVTTCHLLTPFDETLNFTPGMPSEYGDRYEALPLDILQSCSVVVRNLQESDSGIWKLFLRNDTGEGRSSTYNLNVIPKPEEEENNDNIIWLNTIQFPTRTGRYIDISLNKTDHPEDCYIRKPDGSDANATTDGVTVHNSSDFVSCRITIGPMDDALFGDWTLCGRIDSGKERCQLVSITSQHSGTYSIATQENFDHVVNFGGTLTPEVQGHTDRLTCHIITNNDEDLVISADSGYPNLKLVLSERHTCKIAIGPIAETMLGNWTLYGRFSDFTGISEVRKPMHLFLYDDNNPYDQAYNVTERNPVKRVAHLESTVSIDVTNTGKVDSCQGTTPSGDVFDLDSPSDEGASFVLVEESTACRMTIDHLAKNHLGNWTVIGKFSSNGLFTEIHQTTEILEEDPENPLVDEDRVVENMTEQHITTDIGKTHRISIASNIVFAGESCHIMTPAGLQYALIDGFNVEGVEIIKEEAVECGVLVHVLSKDAVGTWTLIARATQSSQLIERRLPFTIVVEEYVDAFPSEIIIMEGNYLRFRLAHSTPEFATCRLLPPPAAWAVLSLSLEDPLHVQSCGYIIPNINTTDAGIWEIIYGSQITYRAKIVVNVTTNAQVTWNNVVELTLNHAVNRTVGPESPVYCHLQDPQGVTVFDGFGACFLVLDRVASSHSGTWKMALVSTGKLVAEEHNLFVTLKTGEGKPEVVTRVEQAKPIVTVSCSVATDAVVHACKFRDPQGKMLLAAPGLSEDRYAFHGSGNSQSGVYECGLQITDPENTDLGLWRCAISTEENTHYGFLSVLCPWALADPVVAASVQQEPILAPQMTSISAVDDEPVTMSCTIEAAIRYCYFRAQNGTTFTVYPGMTDPDVQYAGAGFDAGECGIRFHNMKRSDRGPWACHVGLATDHTEHSEAFNLDVQNAMVVMRGTHFTANNNATLFVEGRVHSTRTLEYCRFVRIDGLGFTTENVPTGYTGVLRSDSCDLNILDPSILDRHPWTVVAKAQGLEREFSAVTADANLATTADPLLPTTASPEYEGHLPGGPHPDNSGLNLFLIIFLSVMLFLVIIVALLGPKKNRKWAFSRASAVRTSLQKQPLPPQAPIGQTQEPISQMQNQV